MGNQSNFSPLAQQSAKSATGGYENGLTLEELQAAMPPHLKSAATQKLADHVNTIVQDPQVAEQIRTNFLSYTSVLKEGRFKIEDYMNAVVYVSYKLMGYTNVDSYKRTFPQRYATLKAKGCDNKTVSAYVAAYNKGQLPNLILEQSLVPSWVLNQSLYQQAINVQADLMRNASSEKVRRDAADSIMTHLKRPETHQVELNLGAAESDGMKELKDSLTQLAEYQKDLIRQGVSTKQVAHQKMGETLSAPINGEARDVTPIGSSGSSGSRKNSG